jgi:prepilin-type processing-associated H-X9-DG protein
VGFTLVELLIVVGVIAVLVGLLLPVLARARNQANAVACAAQLRNLMQGVLIYASENKGSLPYGFCWQRMDASNPGAPDPNAGTLTVRMGRLAVPVNYIEVSTTDFKTYKLYSGFHWTALVNDAASKSRNGGTYPDSREYDLTGKSALLAQISLSKAFRCPEMGSNPAYADVANSYAANMVAMPNQSYELAPGGAIVNARISLSGVFTFTGTGESGQSIAPAKLGQLYPDNAILWDTPVLADSDGGGALYVTNLWGGWTVSGIDNGLLLDPLRASKRYRGVSTDRYNPAIHKWLMPDQSIYMPMTAEGNRDVFDGNYPTDPSGQPSAKLNSYNFMGGARFRHMNNTVCNVAFADGSVQGLTLNYRKAGWTSNGLTSAQSNFLRKYLQIKRPAVLPAPSKQNFRLP